MMMMMELGWWEHERELRSGNHKGWRWEDTGDYIYFQKSKQHDHVEERWGLFVESQRSEESLESK